MKFIDKHKAALITALIAGSVLLLVFNMHLTRKAAQMAETYYELNPEQNTPKEQLLKELTQQQQAKAETNKAFNETQNTKRFAQAYNPITPPKAFEHSKNTETETVNELTEATETTETNSEGSSLNSDELSSFNSVNSILKARSPKKQSNASNGNNTSNKIAMNASANKNSSMHYSLVDRTHQYLPTPIYLCEASGKVVVNITVNAAGDVTDTYINSSSTTDNACLIDSALEYAKKARFNAKASKPSQIGSITFYFEGKH
ncbi:energy transducer TonB family protein [Formosa sp. A9]|uniref:energy transducer TonB family protein n=1 Tax=Formosa sp. A9 TaxID=3442641 RepID=UPI003EB9F05E